MDKLLERTIARTGRVQSWLDNPESRLPVSCTVFVVEDQMEGPNGIEASWRFASHALRNGAGCAIHLSNLRPRGHENGKGLVASGPVSFGKIYSILNETLRRGGVYKNGAITLTLDIWHDDIIEFVRCPRVELPWVKRCVNLTQESWDKSNRETKAAIIHGIKSGDIWLAKIKHDKNGKRIRSNVCLEIFLPSRGTCLLQHCALSACGIGEIRRSIVGGMQELCELHPKTGVGLSGEYLSPEEDRQVGFGFLGLANLLGQHGVTYAEFGDALHEVLTSGIRKGVGGIIAGEIHEGVKEAAEVAKYYKMDRAFCIAPTASCSYRTKTFDGYTSTPEIAPPISRIVSRDSGTFGVKNYDYGNVEIASEVGWDAYKKVADNFMRILDSTGLLHGYSFNSWSDVVTYDENFVAEWLRSPQTSLYYSLQVMSDTQDKSDAYAALDAEDVQDYLDGIVKQPITCDCQE
ncbi:MAG: ribonucleotide reductase [Flavobacteriales bacterium]|nr:ribonucleotide reductase [Flavobacteriales bacterium]|tara:strand:- start:4365 stop:5750 length:1386 start_codon:yes stop_codon:yes gene_type:complete